MPPSHDPQKNLIDRLSTNLLTMGRYLVPEMFQTQSPDFHYDLEEHLRDVKQQLTVVVSPRGHAKSSVVACLLVLWHIFFEDRYREIIGVTRINGPKLVVLGSKTQKEAKKRLRTIKMVLGDGRNYSPRFRQIFGDWGESTAELWNQEEIILKDGTHIIATGTGQQARGMKSGHRRPTLIVSDDPEDENNTKTEQAMWDNRRWLVQAMIPSLDEQVGRAIVIGTPINTQCMVVVLQSTAGWRCLWYQNDAEANQSKWYDSATGEWRIYDGVLWPGYIGRNKLLQRRESALTMGMVSSYYREWEAVVIGDEDQIFKPEYLKTWLGDTSLDGVAPYIVVRRRNGKDLEEPEKLAVLTFVGVDPASSVAERADKTAIVNIAVDNNDNIYVLPGIWRRMPPDQVVDSIARNHKAINPFRGIVETTAAYEYIPVYLRKEHRIAYFHDKPTIKKVGEGSRLESLQPLFAQGKIHLWEGPEVWDVAREQLLAYPRGEDDWIDALEKVCRIRTRPWHGLGDSDKKKKARVVDYMTT